MVQQLKNKLYLILIKRIYKFVVHTNKGGCSAPLSRLFYFKVIGPLNGQVFTFGDDVSSAFGSMQYLTTFFMHKSKESIMLHSKSSRRRISSRIPLDDKFAILSLAIETAIAKITELEGSESINVKGIRIAFNEFSKQFKYFTDMYGLYPDNEVKIKQAARKLNYSYNHLLNGVIESVNIIPRTGCVS